MVLVLLLAFNCIAVLAGQSEKPATVNSNTLTETIDSLLASSQANNAFAGVSIVNVKTGMSVYEFNGNRNFLPASDLKLLTSGAALEYLGGDYRFTTKLYLNGNTSSNGEFFGDIIILGGGDPSINASFYNNPEKFFDEFISALKSLGIKSIKGNIIGDDNCYDDEYYPNGWSWDDLKYPYAAQINALSAFDNKVVFTITPNEEIGLPANISVTPANDYIQVVNNVTTGNTSTVSSVNLTNTLFSNFVYLNGKISSSAAIGSEKSNEIIKTLSINNPTLFFVNIFKDLLIKNDIAFDGSLFDIDNYQISTPYSQMKLIATAESPQLRKIISFMNHYSDNLIAENILKTLAYKNSGLGTFGAGTDCLIKYARKAGISTQELRLYDGSGLSRMNLMSPSDFTTLLTYIYKSKYKDDFVSSLATPSENGTLKDRLPELTQRLWAKTGSMSGVNNLCGYIETADNQMCAFSVMLLNTTISIPNSSKIIDAICNQIASYSVK